MRFLVGYLVFVGVCWCGCWLLLLGIEGVMRTIWLVLKLVGCTWRMRSLYYPTESIEHRLETIIMGLEDMIRHHGDHI